MHLPLYYHASRAILRGLTLLVVCCSPLMISHTWTVKSQTALELKKPIEREVGGGQAQDYQISLEAGQWAGISIEVHGVDVVAFFLNPDGKVAVEYDREIGFRPEQISLVADTTARYSLRIEAKYKKAKAG